MNQTKSQIGVFKLNTLVVEVLYKCDNMTVVFLGLLKDLPTAVIMCGIQPLTSCVRLHDSHWDILYQPHGQCHSVALLSLPLVEVLQ